MRRLRLLSLAATVSAGTVSVPFTRSNPNPALSGVAKRDSLSVTAINNITGGGYYADFEVGTPGQKLSFLLDTGSSDTWVNSVDSDLCSSKAEQRRVAYCTSTFNPNDSSTFELVDQNGFNITYLDDRNIQGDYFNDTFTVNGKAIKNQQLGLALETVRPTGIMGLGFSANVASDVKYPTIVDNMVSQGYINTPAYSLYLNDIDSNSGTVLFGGIDKDKFIGNLTTLPLTNAFQDKAGNITSFSVMLKGFQVKTPSGKTDVDIGSLNAVAILDSGSTICLLPDNQVDAIYSEFDVHLVQSVSSPFIDCAYRGDKGKGFTFDFIFEGKTISVPMDEMVINAFDDMQDVISQDPVLGEVVADWDGACLFGIGPASDYGISTDRFALLGDTFLRSAYVVYDLANNQLGLAQANLNSTSSDIVELKAGDKDLPDVEGASSKSPTATSTGASSGRTVTVTAGADATAGQSGNGDDNAAGHAVPGAAVAVMMAVGAALVVL